MSAYEIARAYAAGAHAAVGQRRKYTGEPYVLHPIAVAGLVREAGGDEEMIQAALLHDVIEDTQVTEADLGYVFSARVVSLVVDLTDITDLSLGNRATRKRIERERWREKSPAAMTIKLADLIDNTRSIVEHDPGFARTYLREKVRLLEFLKGGDQPLYAHAHFLAMDGVARLAVDLSRE